MADELRDLVRERRDSMIYLDYAATSGKKPETVYKAVDEALRYACGNPGRSGHQVSRAADGIVEEARFLCNRFFHGEGAEHIIFGNNATDMLNLAVHGMAKKGGTFITSLLEHNSVSRPLEVQRKRGARVLRLPVDMDRGIEPEQVEAAIDKKTCLVVINHMSNVTGTVTDVGRIGRICRSKNVPFLVDASQSAGILHIDVQAMCIDLLAFPGHKGLYGPQGTGGLYIRPGILPQPLKQGGTGSHSELAEQPQELPDRYESGTLNVPGLAGLAAGIRFVMETGTEVIAEREAYLTRMLIEGLSAIKGVQLLGPGGEKRGPVVSLTIDAADPQEAAALLDQLFGIAVRSGLHCAPDAHRILGTLERGGTIRISPGYFTTEEEIAACIKAIEAISRGEA